MAACTVPMAFLILCLLTHRLLVVWADQRQTLYTEPNYQLNYTITEESPIPIVLGNLVIDLGLTDWMLKHTMDIQPDDRQNFTARPLSIDVIANAGRLHFDSISEMNVPRLRLFPSNQWGSKYFSVHFSSILIQELVLLEPMDLENACKEEDPVSSDFSLTHEQCICFSEVCTSTAAGANAPACKITLTIAMHPLQPGMTVYIINVFVRDVNDNTPRFDVSSPFHLTFKENDVPGTVRELPTAVDNDLCENAQIRYTLMTPEMMESKKSSVFRLHVIPRSRNRTQIELVLQRPLDREITDTYDFYLLATDQAKYAPKRTGTLSIRVVIEDINDCRPIFDIGDVMERNGTCISSTEAYRPTIHIRIPENKGPVPWLLKYIKAFDADFGLNGQIHFQFGPRIHPLTRNYFRLNYTSGELWVVQSLDRENTPMQDGLHRLIVLAMDSGTPVRSSQLLIFVYLLDVNDNAPRIRLMGEGSEFTQDSAMMDHLQERSQRFWTNLAFSPDSWKKELQWPVDLRLSGVQHPGQIIATLITSDPDRGVNGTVDCRLGKQWPERDEHNSDQWTKGWFKLNPLIMFNDKQSGTAENSMKIEQNSLNSRAHSKYGNRTQEKTFTLETVWLLDPSSIAQLFVQIICQDQGPNRLTTERTFHFHLVNAKDQPRLRWTAVKLLSDAITPNNMTCIPSDDLTQTANRAIPVESSQRIIRLDIPYETDNSTRLVPALCLTYELTDTTVENKWHKDQAVSLFQLIASFDRTRFEDNWKLMFHLAADLNPQDVVSLFDVNAESGEVKLWRSSLQSTLSPGEYKLRLQAVLSAQTLEQNVDESLEMDLYLHVTSTANVVLYYFRREDGLFDLNNNSILHLNVPESALIGSQLQPESVFYCITEERQPCRMELYTNAGDQVNKSPHSREFRIQAVSENKWIRRTRNHGVPHTLVTNALLDREIRETYRLRLVVYRLLSFDDPVHARTLLIHITDVNDNRPVLLNPFYPVTRWPPSNSICTVPIPNESGDLEDNPIYVANLSISYQEQIGFPIFQIHAVDRDVGENGRLTYTLNEVYQCMGSRAARLQSFNSLTLENQSGLLRVAKELSRSFIANYFLQITVSDSPEKSTALKAIAMLQLNILDIPRYQRPINDLPDTVIKSPLKPFPFLHSREAARFPGNATTDYKPASVSSHQTLIEQTTNKANAVGLLPDNPWLQRLLLVSLFVALSVICPTVICWIVYIQRGRIRRCLFRTRARSTIRRNTDAVENGNRSTTSTMQFTEKSKGWNSEQFRMIEVHANPFAIEWDYPNDPEQLSPACIRREIPWNDQRVRTDNQIARTSVCSFSPPPDGSPGNLCALEDAEALQLGIPSWKPMLNRTDQFSSSSFTSFSRNTRTFYRSNRNNSERHRPSDSTFDLRVLNQTSPVSVGSIHQRLGANVDPYSPCLTQSRSSGLPYSLRPRQSSVEEQYIGQTDSNYDQNTGPIVD